MLIADRHTLFREALKAALDARPEYEVVAEASDGIEALELAGRLHPDIVLLDLFLPGLPTLVVMRLLGQQMPNIKKVIVTDSELESDVLEAVQAGANGYVLKSATVDMLLEQLDRVISGGVAMTEEVTRQLMHALAVHLGSGPSTGPQPQSLSSPDVEILDLVTRGMTNREIAQVLAISEHTVRAHVRGLMQKLHVENRTQLAVYSTRVAMGLDTKQPSNLESTNDTERQRSTAVSSTA